MALGTYDDLLVSVGKFLARTDLTAIIPDFVTLAEASMNRVLKTPKMLQRSTAPIDTEYFVVPTDWLETLRFQITADKVYVLELAGYDEMADYRRADNTSGIPAFYAHVGDQFEIYPTPVAEYPADLLYYSAIPALAPLAQTNWLLTAAPDAYLYGSLMAAAPYLQHDQRVAVWGGLYERAIQELNTQGQRALESGSGLRLRMRS